MCVVVGTGRGHAMTEWEGNNLVVALVMETVNMRANWINKPHERMM